MWAVRSFFDRIAAHTLVQRKNVRAIDSNFLKRSVEIDRVQYTYQIYVPSGYTVTTASPLILALHGKGERGRDGQLQIEVGLGKAIRQYPDRYPAIVVFPQVPLDRTWQGLGAQIVIAALDRTIAEFNIDLSRVYLMGLSMGGNGSWYLANCYPQRFAAMVVVCGWIGPRFGQNGILDYPAIGADIMDEDLRLTEVIQRFDRLPIWMFHGEADSVVSVRESRIIVAALQAIGANIRYTEFPHVNHNAWDRAYTMMELSTWLFQQQRL